MNMIDEIKGGNKRAAARLISMIENNDEQATVLLKECWQFSDKSSIIGITGPPGAGKSTLTDQLAKHLLKQGKRVGIIAVDPSSPISGGAFLGDRIRMSDLNTEPDVFIRSMGTRGALGGISKAVHGAIRVLEAFGMDTIFVETVGVGQSEVDIADVVDTVVLVTVPGMGDDIQAEKAGILEVADLIVVNKADHAETDRTIHFLKSMLGLTASMTSEVPDVEILSTIATEGKGVLALLEAIDRQQKYLKESGKAILLQKKRLRSELLGLLYAHIIEHYKAFDHISNATEESLTAILYSGSDPYSEVEVLLLKFLNRSG